MEQGKDLGSWASTLVWVVCFGVVAYHFGLAWIWEALGLAAYIVVALVLMFLDARVGP